MRAIVGPVEIKGLGAGKLSLGSLYEGDLGFGSLDGLLFASEDYKTAIVVTTRSLFMRWLRAHKLRRRRRCRRSRRRLSTSRRSTSGR